MSSLAHADASSVCVCVRSRLTFSHAPLMSLLGPCLQSLQWQFILKWLRVQLPSQFPSQICPCSCSLCKTQPESSLLGYPDSLIPTGGEFCLPLGGVSHHPLLPPSALLSTHVVVTICLSRSSHPRPSPWTEELCLLIWIPNTKCST